MSPARCNDEEGLMALLEALKVGRIWSFVKVLRAALGWV